MRLFSFSNSLIVPILMKEISGGTFMRLFVRYGAFLLLITGFLVSCAPNKAMTRNSDGISGHEVKADAPQTDEKYAGDDDFDVESSDLDKEPQVATSPKAKTSKKAQEVNSREIPMVSSVRQVKGEEAKPSKDGFYQTGIASWYGREFNGKKTASGEKFDMNEMTAAHKTLPLGSVVVVKNLDNGKSVKVRINDRGPYKGKRILDLSYAAAKKLDMVGDGQALVGIKMIGAGTRDYSSADDDVDTSEVLADDVPVTKVKAKNVKAVSAPVKDMGDAGSFSLQAGAFYTKKNADKLKSRLEDLFPGKEVVITHDQDLYKVLVVGISTRNDAEKYKKTLKSESVDAFIVEQ
jgi:rare lipoprotein A